MPVDNWIGVNVDLSQAESRVTDHILYHLCGKEFYRWRALVRPDEYDQHTARAATIFEKPPEQVSKIERYLGKRTVHAYQRNMGAQTLWENILKDMAEVEDFQMPSIARCQELLGKLDVAEPEIKGVYFPWVRQQLMATQRLTNSWGRRVDYTFETAKGTRFSDALYRKGYSFFPQSEVSDWMNQKGTIPFYQGTKGVRKAGKLKMNAHVHDSLFFSCDPVHAYDAAYMLVMSLERPRVMYGHELVIPCEVEIGRTWKGGKGWKRLPSRAEFERAVEEVLAS